MSDQYVENDIYLINIGGDSPFSGIHLDKKEFRPAEFRPALISATSNSNISLDSFADVNDDRVPQMSEYKVQFNGGTYTLGDFITVDKEGVIHLHPLITENGERISPEMWVIQPHTDNKGYPDALAMRFGEQTVYLDLADVNTLTIDPGVNLEVRPVGYVGEGHVWPKLGSNDKQSEINLNAARTWLTPTPNEDSIYKIDFNGILANPGAFIKETEFTTPSSPTPSASGVNPPKGFLDNFGQLIPESDSLAVEDAKKTEEEQKTLAQKLEEFLESLDVDHDGDPDRAGIPVAIKKLLGPSK